MSDKLTYKDAGVNIDAGNYSVKLIKDSVRATYRPEVLGDLGFGQFAHFRVGEHLLRRLQIVVGLHFNKIHSIR